VVHRLEAHFCCPRHRMGPTLAQAGAQLGICWQRIALLKAELTNGPKSRRGFNLVPRV
jgi:hypothetical protein